MYIEMYFSEVCVTSENAEGCNIYLVFVPKSKFSFLYTQRRISIIRKNFRCTLGQTSHAK